MVCDRMWGVFAVCLCGVPIGCYSGNATRLGGDADDALGTSSGGADASGNEGAGDGDGGSTGTGGQGLDPACATPDASFQPLLRLTRKQYKNAIRDLFGVDAQIANGFPADEKVGAFESNATAPISDLGVELYMGAAEEIAGEVFAELRDDIVPCNANPEDATACAEAFVGQWGRRIHRRPLSAEDASAYLSLFEQTYEAASFDAALQVVLQAMLQSPHFLYHLELVAPEEEEADGVVALDGYSLASRLSFYLWESMPDDALFDAAEDGSLADRDALRDHAERLLADARAAKTLERFHLQWLDVDSMTDVAKDPELFPAFDDELRTAMKRDVADFARYVILEGDGSLQTLISGSFTLTEDPDLLAIYGVERDEGLSSGEPLELDPQQRAGILTLPAVLAKAAHAAQSSPVHRGVVIRENLLCQNLPPPPDDVDDTPPDPDPNATTREQFAEHTENPTCAGCHVLIDGLGFGLEHYDAVGAFRTHDGNLPVDASGEIAGTSDINGPFVGAVELADRLAESRDVRACVSAQWLQFGLGRELGDEDACSNDGVYAAFEDSDYDLPSLIVSVVLSDAFRYQRIEQGE